MADLVYPPVIVAIKSLWKYLGLKFDFEGEENIPRKGGAILAMLVIWILQLLERLPCLPVVTYASWRRRKFLITS
jgi:1-acyl-sn-glycerol-3-phosphate acyltransferase